MIRLAGYTLGIRLYQGTILAAALFSPKARAWLRGRRQYWSAAQAKIGGRTGWIWMHCASLGEFEQGREVFERMRNRYPEKPGLITFFSPSGYEPRKRYPGADLVLYLPLDTPANARRLLDLLQPSLILWIRYEFWIHLLHEMARRSLPALLISARLPADAPYLKPIFRPMFQKALEAFRMLFTQDEKTAQLLTPLAPGRVVQAGDTRFDRVSALARGFEPMPEVMAFAQSSPAIVCGSTWPVCEKLWMQAWPRLKEMGIKLIFAPHEIHPDRIANWKALFPEDTCVFSEGILPDKSILWVDRIGLLGRLYGHGAGAYVGGGLGSGGLHNILEPAAYGLPVAFGPRHTGFPEASALLRWGGATLISGESGLLAWASQLAGDDAWRQAAGKASADFVASQMGAVRRIETALSSARFLQT